MSDFPPSHMISKWSSKSPKEKANRIRNNQRRHRAKIKAHVSSLEADLAEAQRKLAAAEHRIKALSAEVEHLRNEMGGALSTTNPVSVKQPTGLLFPQGSVERNCCQTSNKRRRLHTSPSCGRDDPTDLSLTTPARPDSAIRCDGNPSSGLPIEYYPGVDDSRLTIAFVAQYDCQNLPPPQPGETTTSCKAAYKIITQQNFKGVDLDAIHEWLQSGYRSATALEDGCTVVNSLLYSLIDYLNPV